MSWPVYSVRFLSAYGVAGFHDYYVPAGKRAVVVDISASNVFGLAGVVQVHAVASVAWSHSFLASQETAQWTGRLVLYSGELLRVYTAIAEHGVNISGYELDAPAGTQDEPPPFTVHELPELGKPVA